MLRCLRAMHKHFVITIKTIKYMKLRGRVSGGRLFFNCAFAFIKVHLFLGSQAGLSVGESIRFVYGYWKPLWAVSSARSRREE